MSSYRIPNTYQSPIGSALGNLMTAFASMPSPEERALKAAQVDQAQSTAALNRQKVIDSQREAEQSAAFGRNLSGAFRKAFTPVEDARPSPDFVGPIPEVPPDIRARNAAIDLAGSLPEKQIGQLPELFLSLFANAPGTTPEAVTRAGMGAKVGYNQTQLGAEAERDRKLEVEKMRDERAQRAAMYAADRAAKAQEAIADRQLAQQDRTPKITVDTTGASPTGYVYFAPGLQIDGKGAPPPNASEVLANKAASSVDSLNRFSTRLAQGLALAEANPNLLGLAGTGVRVAQGATSQIGSIAKAFGLDLDAAVEEARQVAASKGVAIPTGAQASELDTVMTMLPREAARAFGEGTGAGFSNRDVERYERAFGVGPLANIADFRARIGRLQQMVKDDIASYSARAGNKATPGLGSSVTNTFQQPAAAPVTAPTAAPVRRRYNPATGQIE